MSAGENEQAVKRGCTALTTATGFHSDCGRRAFQDVTEANAFAADGAREAHSVRFARTPTRAIAPCRFLFLNVHVYPPITFAIPSSAARRYAQKCHGSKPTLAATAFRMLRAVTASSFEPKRVSP
jgi:hypothetical protein